MPEVLSLDSLDQRLAFVGTSGSGKTYAAKGFVEQLLEANARVCVVDPLGVWWGLRAGADGVQPGFPVVVFGGRHADVELGEQMGPALGRLIGTGVLACVIDLSGLGSSAARRRFMAAFLEALYEANEEPLHLVLDEADLWAPQRPQPDAMLLLGRTEEIVRRGRVRGFVPWLITQRPAVIAKDVLSQADVLIAMKLTSSQDRDAIGAWIEGQADRAEGKRIQAELPRMGRGEGWLWAPADEVLERVTFAPIRTFDSSRTPKRGERIATPRSLAAVDLSAIAAALASVGETAIAAPRAPRPSKEAERQIATASARIAELEAEVAQLRERIGQIAAIAGPPAPPLAAPAFMQQPVAQTPLAVRAEAAPAPPSGSLHPAARKLLAALAQHAPGRFSWQQAATLAGLRAAGGHYNAGRKQLRELALVDEGGGLVSASSAGLAEAGEVPATPSSPGERLELWCGRLPSPAPDMLRALAAQGERFILVADLAQKLGKKPAGGHWNSGVAVLRNNGLIETDGKRLRAANLLRTA